MKKEKNWKKLFSECLVILAGVFLLSGCAGVEPEKRAYPLAVSIDYQEGMYQVIYGMANLPADTGQGKDPQAGGAEQNAGKIFYGKDMQEIHALYDASQEYDLDLGHVQAVILGDGLLASGEGSSAIFQYMEDSAVLGKSIYVFRTADPAALMALNQTNVDSLGDYLTGLYENRIGTKAEKPLTLENFFYSWNNYGRLAEIPEVQVKDGQIFLKKVINETLPV